MLENEWSAVSQNGRFRTQKCGDLKSYVLHFGTFGICLIGLFWSLGYSLSTSHDTRSPIWSWETHLQHVEHDVLLQLCSKYFAGMCLMWNFNFQITTVSSELTLRQYLKRGGRKLRLLGFGKSRTVLPLIAFLLKQRCTIVKISV